MFVLPFERRIKLGMSRPVENIAGREAVVEQFVYPSARLASCS